jgi:hypothetical protein
LLQRKNKKIEHRLRTALKRLRFVWLIRGESIEQIKHDAKFKIFQELKEMASNRLE